MRIIKVLLVLPFLFCSVFAQEEIWNAKADKAMFDGKFPEAIEFFSKSLQIDKMNKHALYNRGLAYLYSEQFDKSVTDFSKVLELDSKHSDAYNNRGLALNYMGLFDSALVDLNRAIQLEPNFVEAYINRGTAYFGVRLIDKAMEDFDKAISLDSANPSVFFERGRMNYIKKNFKKSAEDFSKAIQLGIKNPKIYYNRANSYFKNEQYDLAISDYSKSLQLDSNGTDVLNNRAAAFEMLAIFDKASIDSLEAILKDIKSPDYKSLVSKENKKITDQVNQGLQKLERNELKQAISNFSKAIEFKPNKPYVHLLRGLTYLKAGNFSQAISDFSFVLKAEPENLDALKNRFYAYKQFAQSDRNLLAKKTGTEGRFKDIDSLKFVTYTDSLNNFKIELPDSWFTAELHETDVDEFVVAMDKITDISSLYPVGVRIVVNRNMEKNFKVRSASDLIDFWRGSAMKNAQDYYKYEIMSAKNFKKGEYMATLNKTILQTKQEIYPLKLFELILAKDDVLIFAYMQCPEVQFPYFEKIFERAVNSFEVK